MSRKQRQPREHDEPMKSPEPRVTSTDLARALDAMQPLSDCQTDSRLILTEGSLYAFGRGRGDGVVWIREAFTDTLQEERIETREILICGRQALEALRHAIDLELADLPAEPKPGAVRWFSKGAGIAKSGPYATQAAAARSLVLEAGNFPKDAFVWPEEG